MTHWTVVVPTFERPQGLRRTLAALQRLEAPPGGVEVLVVDDGGNSPAAPVVEEVRGPHPVRVHRQQNAGPAAARNAGARHAAGQRLAFTDDDCLPDPGWLTALDVALTERDTAAVPALAGGPTVNALHDNLWAEASQRVVDHVIAHTPGGFLPTCNLGVDRRQFLDSGGFDERFPRAAGEDRAFCDQWRSSGGRIVWTADACVRHEHDLGPAGFWRQHAAYGEAARTVHAAPGGSRPGRVGDYWTLVAGPVLSREPHRAGLSARLLLSQAATGWGLLRAGLGRETGP